MESYQTILVVDDEKTNVEFIVANLEQEYKIKTAPNGFLLIMMELSLLMKIITTSLL